MPYHVWADRVSPLVIGVGDPARAELFASILDGALVINTNRYLIYTGRLGKREVTVAAHGIGGPSAAILLEELKKLGMEVFVRIGTAGSLGDLSIGDVVVASAAAAPVGGLYGAYFGGFTPTSRRSLDHCETGLCSRREGGLRRLKRRLLWRRRGLCGVLEKEKGLGCGNGVRRRHGPWVA